VHARPFRTTRPWSRISTRKPASPSRASAARWSCTAAAGNPTISADGKPLALGEPGRTADFASLRKSPYKIPTPWIAMYYFHLDNDALARLGEARSLGIEITESTKEGNRKLEYQAQLEADTRLREFGSR
jgi:hypothetical protein